MLTALGLGTSPLVVSTLFARALALPNLGLLMSISRGQSYLRNPRDVRFWPPSSLAVVLQNLKIEGPFKWAENVWHVAWQA